MELYICARRMLRYSSETLNSSLNLYTVTGTSANPTPVPEIESKGVRIVELGTGSTHRVKNSGDERSRVGLWTLAYAYGAEAEVEWLFKFSLLRRRMTEPSSNQNCLEGVVMIMIGYLILLCS